MSTLPPTTERYLEELVERLSDVLGPALAGAYLHGSAALGDFSEARSDIDVLAVSARPLSASDKDAIASRLSQHALPCPATGLEFHALRRDAITLCEAPPFELHLATATDGRPDRVVEGAAHPGDPDLVMHFAVLHEHGRALLGPAPETVFPAIPRRMLLAAFRRELEWATEDASPSYQVLNACRAWRYAEEGVLCSKTAGGEWARERAADPAAVDGALRHRARLTGSDPEPDATRGFVMRALEALERAQAAASFRDGRGGETIRS